MKKPTNLIGYVAAFFAGVMIAVSTAAAATFHTSPREEPRVLVSKIGVFDCDNRRDIPEQYFFHADIMPAISRLNNACQAQENAFMLMQIWEEDPMAGMVYE